MSVIKIWNYFKGYVIIIIEGVSPERFINLTIARGMALWNVIRVDYTTIMARISLKDFRKIRPIARRTKTKVKIKGKKGFPFFLSKLKKRKILMVAPVLILASIILLTSYLWEIEIKENTNMNPEVIIEKLKDLGIDTGTAISRIEIESLRHQLLVEIPELSWVGLEIKGTKLIIDARDRATGFKGPDYSNPSDIIAKKNGIIEKIVVKRGTPLVSKGDVVGPGQLLVTGLITHLDGQQDYGPAVAELYAKVQYQSQQILPLSYTEVKATGKKFVVKKLSVFGYNLGGETTVPFEDYEQAIITKKNIGWRNFKLPVEVITEQYSEVQRINHNYSMEEAEEKAFHIAFEQTKKELSKEAEIVNIIRRANQEQDTITVTVVVETMEEIGYQKLLQKEDK